MDAQEKKSCKNGAENESFRFPFACAQKMFELMSKCCGDKSGNFNCCSEMEKKMGSMCENSKGN